MDKEYRLSRREEYSLTYPDWWENNGIGDKIYNQKLPRYSDAPACILCNEIFMYEKGQGQLDMQIEWNHFKENHPDYLVLLTLQVPGNRVV